MSTAKHASVLALLPNFAVPYFGFTGTAPSQIFVVVHGGRASSQLRLRAACALHCAICVPDPVQTSLPRVLSRQRTHARPSLPGAAAVKVHMCCVHDARARNNMLPSAPEPARCMGTCIHDVDSESCSTRCAHDMVGSGVDHTTLTAGV